jgi:hypothetical protein
VPSPLTDGGEQHDAHVEDSSLDHNVDHANDPPRPAGLAEAWQLDRRLDRSCGIYVSPKRDAYPPALTWETCSADAVPGSVCQRVSTVPGEKAPPGFSGAWVDQKGQVFVTGWRTGQMTSGSYWFIANTDGAIQTALFHQECGIDRSSVNAGRYAVKVLSDRAETSGFYAGEIGESSPRLAVLTNTRAFTVVPGSLGLFFESTAFELVEYSWEDGGLVGPFWSKAQDHGLDQGDFVHTPEAMFWTADNLDYAKVNVHTRAGGIHDFLTAGLVIDRGYADLGTDGKDMVWMYGHDRVSGSTTPYDHYDVMAAPYTTDPTKVASRRLRSEEGPQFGGSPFVVGCGYAARSNGYRTRVVRLSDGRSWLLVPSATGFQIPRALTCTELFGDILVGGYSTLGRVRLDSLGPGIAPD